MNGFFTFFLAVALILFIVFLIWFGPFLIMLAWNYCMPFLFGLPKIGWLHAFLLSFLWSCLFGNRNDK